MKYTYEYPRPMLTVDAIVFRKAGKRTEILLIKRGNEPYKDMWALPGGFVDMDEDLHEAVSREVYEETGLSNMEFKQFRAYGKPTRDPRGRNIAIVFYAECKDYQTANAGDDASDTKWVGLNFDNSKTSANVIKLAFDHNQIVDDWYFGKMILSET